MKHVEILVLRGAHSQDKRAIKESARLLKDADIILFEAIMPTSAVKRTRNGLNSLINNPAYAKKVYEQAREWLEGDLFAQILWKLREKDRLRFVDFVDVKFHPIAFKRKAQNLLPASRIDKLMRQLSARPARRYTLVRKWVASYSLQIKRRDLLVAQQTIDFMKGQYKDKVEYFIEKQGKCVIALWVGYAHRPGEFLKLKDPSLKVTEKIYGKRDVEMLLDSQAGFLTRATLTGELPTNKEIDYLLYDMLTETDDDETPSQEGVDVLEHHAQILKQGSSHHVFDAITKTSIQPIERYSEEELRTLVDSLLKK
jgi:hypothetical protein